MVFPEGTTSGLPDASTSQMYLSRVVSTLHDAGKDFEKLYSSRQYSYLVGPGKNGLCFIQNHDNVWPSWGVCVGWVRGWGGNAAGKQICVGIV